MKRTHAAFMLLFIFLIVGCGSNSDSSKEATPTGEDTRNINSKAAEGFMKHYLTYVVDMNENAKRSFYSSRLLQEIGSEDMEQEPHPVGYILGGDEASEAGSSFSANLLFEVTGKPDFSIDTYSYTLIDEKGLIKIDKISKEGSVELIGEEDKVYIKKDEESEKQLSVTLDDLPGYSVMQTGASPEKKFPVPKDKFTSCGIASDGENIVVTSSDDAGSGCFVAKVTMKKEEEAVQQEGDEQGGKQEGDKQGQEKSQEKEESNGIAKPLDLISGCQAYGITFSPEFDKFIVGLLYSDGIKGFRIYDMESGKIVDARVDFLGDKVSSEMPYFVSSKEILFKVTVSEGATDEEKSYEGKWSLDMESGKIKQLQ